MTQQEILEEYWAYHYAENGVAEEVEDEEFDLDAELARIAAEAEKQPDEWEEVKLNEQ